MQPDINELFVLPRCEAEIEILREEPEFLLIHKPHRLLSVPGRNPQNFDSVLSRLQQNFPSAGIVHRLDFDTSGVMVVPLTKLSLSHISKQFQARTVTKHYIAVVAGLLAEEVGTINLPIAADQGPTYKISAEAGKPSLTEYRVLDRDLTNSTTRVLLQPITGRSHQLRLHMAAVGHPILGCEFYGGSFARAASRLLLHARDLQFTHPITNEQVAITREPEF